MFSKIAKIDKILNKIVLKFPKKSLLFTTLSIASSFLLGPLALMPGIIIGQSLLREYTRIVFSKKHYQNVYSPGEYKNNYGELIATLVTYQSKLPLIKMSQNITAEERGEALASLTGDQFLEFYERYIKILLFICQYFTDIPVLKKEYENNQDQINQKWQNTYPILRPFRFYHVVKDSSQHLQDELERRKFDFTTGESEKEISGFVAKINELIEQHNKQLPWYLKFLEKDKFTSEQMKSLIVFGDVYKGIDGCSAAVQHYQKQSKSSAGEKANTFRFIRLLDWASLGILADYTLFIAYPTNNQDINKPQQVFSVTFSPGLLGLTFINNYGLVISLNEATVQSTKRENTESHAVPQFELIKRICENCTTIEEVKHYIEDHPPATSHILTVCDASGNSCRFDMMPISGDRLSSSSNQLLPTFNVRKSTSCFSDDKTTLSTNHFTDEDDKLVSGSSAFSCSEDRYNRLDEITSTQKKTTLKVADSVKAIDTVQTIVYKPNKGQEQKKQPELSVYLCNQMDPYFFKDKKHRTKFIFEDMFNQKKETANRARFTM